MREKLQNVDICLNRLNKVLTKKMEIKIIKIFELKSEMGLNMPVYWS